MIYLMALLLGVSTHPAPEGSFDAIQEIFGNTVGGQYGSEVIDKENLESEVLHIIQEMTSDIPSQATNPKEEDVEQAVVAVDTAFENCDEYSSFGFACVPYYQCNNGSIITDGEGLIDIRNGFGTLSPEGSKCPGLLDVCCKDPQFVKAQPQEPEYVPKCGRHNAGGFNVKIEGFEDSESQFGEWPHMCAVMHKEPAEASSNDSANLYQCGGSLIAPGVILTAGHCVDKFINIPEQLVVRCGEWNTQNETEPLPHQDRVVTAVTSHPEFNPRNLHNDFALLFTREEFSLAPHIDTVCLPRPGESFDAETCSATGWGKDKFGDSGRYQVILKEVDLNMVNQTECQNRLRKTKLGRRFRLHDSFICAGGQDGKDTCKGDGGSPLVCPSKYDPDTFVQAGVVAWGIGCGEDGTPGVYAAVSQSVCWIDYAMTCYYGKTSGIFSSYWGYPAGVCGAWLEQRVQGLRGRPGAGAVAALNQYEECSVHWSGEDEEDGQVSTLAKLDKEKSDTIFTQTY